MQAVIMAGGEGSRLRPLTCDMPKPMARLCGKPILEYILDLLIRHDFDKATLTLGYMPGMIREHFPEGRYKTMSLAFTEEKSPLGTAGGVRQAAQQFDKDFLVISGDGLCDFDLKSAYEHHCRSGALITIVVTKVQDPREYGLVNVDEKGNVLGFTEKPPWTGVTTNLANTGIYIIHPSVLSMIPQDEFFDFATHLFPKMMAQNMSIMAYEAKGYWCDIGDLESYRQCQADMMNGQIKGVALPQIEEGIFGEPIETGSFQVIPPVYFGGRVRVGTGAVIGPNAVIDDGVEISAGARVRSAIVLPNSIIGKSTRITGGILCNGVGVGAHAAIYEGCVLGSGATVGDYAEILPNVSVWPGKNIENGDRIRENVRIGDHKREYFDEDGITGRVGIEITPEFCVRLGAAVGSLKNAQRVGIGYSGSNSSKAMYHALLAGLCGTGVQVWDLGKITAAQMNFASAFGGLSACVYAAGTDVCTVELWGSDGLPASRGMERELEKILSKGEFVRNTGEHYRDIADMSGFKMLYQQELYRCAPDGLLNIQGVISCDSRETERLFRDTFIRLGGVEGKGPAFYVSEDGRRLNGADEKGRLLNSGEMLALGCLLAFEKGENVSVPYDAPYIINRLAQHYGKECYRYFHIADESQREIRELSKKQYWLKDGMMLALMIMNEMGRRRITLSELTEKLPGFATRVTQVPLHQSPSDAMERLKRIAQPARQGLKIASGDTIIRIWPGKRGNVLQILTEANNVEAAEELSANIRDKISDLLDRKG